MSFGIEIIDDSGEKIFEVGRKYLKIVGSVYFPEASSSDVGIMSSTFSLPASVPVNETPFIKISVFDSAASCILNGRAVTVNHSGTYQRSVYYREAARVYYGYYS